MHGLVYFVLALTPIAVFPVLALPVETYRPSLQAALLIVYIANLTIPLLHAGQYSVVINTVSACFAFASSQKMAVWLFCMSQEERRKQPYYIRFWYWRERMQQKDKKPTAAATGISMTQAITKYLKAQLCTELIVMVLRVLDQNKSIRVFWYMVHRVLGQPTEDHFSIQAIAMSFVVCVLNAAYLQCMMQATYNGFMIVFCAIYYLNPKHAGFRQYVEELMEVPPLFDSPWEATNLRDYWSNRWHTFYNMNFYLLAFKPVRRICDKVPLLRPLRRALPTLAVFALSGTMHEYIVYNMAGPEKYWQEHIAGMHLLFFLLQPVGLVIGDKWFSSGVRGRVFAFTWMIGHSHFFVVPHLVADNNETTIKWLSHITAWIVTKLLTIAMAMGDNYPQQYERMARQLLNAISVEKS